MYSFRLTDGPNGGPGPTSIRSNLRERDLERKRAQGEAACAECRRLRLKCDRKLPCTSCVRRGCPSICPNGSLTTGHGSRFVLANTEKLHSKLIQMSERIRQLEDALQIAQSTLSSSTHPLLSKELLEIKSGIDVLEAPVPEPKDKEADVDAEADIYCEFGTLSISDHGEARFFGRAGAEAFMANAHDQDNLVTNLPPAVPKLPAEITHYSETFPFAPVYAPKDQIRMLIEARMPSYERATALVEVFVQHSSFFFRPVGREQIMEELIPWFYKEQAQGEVKSEGVALHRLALLSAIFALGATGDLTTDKYSVEGELYHQLARTALSLHSIFEGTSLATIQAISLIGLYEFLNSNSRNLESAWKMQALSLSLGSSVGLHWDPSNWGIEKKYIDRRRRLFWELCKLDAFKSLSSGRPATFRMDEIDCQFPEGIEDRLAGRREPIFQGWIYKFVKDIVAPVADKLCSTKAVKYSEILEWDRRIREFSPTYDYEQERQMYPHATNIVTLIFTLYKEITLIFIHRNFFVGALRDNPSNPMQTRFAPSFLTTYSSAITVLRVIRRECECGQSVLTRQWPMWIHTLSSGIVVGSIAAQNSPKELAGAARKELDLAVSLFDKAPQHSIVRNGLPILLRLQERARTFADGKSTANKADSANPEDVDEALNFISGANRVVRRPLRRNGLTLHHETAPAPETPLFSSSTDKISRSQNGQPTTTSTTVDPMNATIPTIAPGVGVLQGGPLPTAGAIGPGPIQYASGADVQGLQPINPPFLTVGGPPQSNSATYDLSNGLNYGTGLPAGFLAQEADEELSISSLGSLSWTPMDWSSFNIPMNYDFDINNAPSRDTPADGLVEPGDSMIQEAWEYLLEDPRIKYSSTASNSFESQLHLF